jgi:esterase/lipase superfamily enzyme
MYLEISTVDGIHEGGAKAAMIPEPNFNTVTVFYGTDRAPGDSELPAEYYGGGRGELTLGKCEVSIPLDHKLGELESPSFWRFEFGENPEKHVVLMSVEPQERKEFLGEIRDRITASGSRAAFVFVHGYNVTFEDAARRTGQMAYDLQFDGAPIFYSWPSKGTFKGYMADEVASQYTVPHLQEFLALLAAESGAETVHLIAHSMGNRSLTAALRELGQEEAGPTFNQIALVAPDIDADIFKRDIVPRIITSGERVTLYASATDEALDASKRVHAAPRAGDASDGAVVVKGIDTIDVTGLDTSFLGHSYFAENSSVISDLIKLLRDGSPPVERTWLEAVPLGRLVYWRFLGHTAVTGREGGSSPR